MNNFIKKLGSLKEAVSNLEQYFLKTSYAKKYRFSSRLVYRSLAYPPTIDGNSNYEMSAKNEENENIKRILRIKEHPETPLFPDEYSLSGPPKGRIYEKFPFKFTVEQGKTYSLCTCGYSNNQPFCDSTHKMLWTSSISKRVPKYRPIKYVAKETKDVWFCNCKQSSNRPLCDGTHKTPQVQTSYSVK